MSQRFTYVKYDGVAVQKQEALKSMYEQIEQFIESNLGASREKALVLTKLEESYMWTGKAIRDEQIQRDSQPQHVPERTNQ